MDAESTSVSVGQLCPSCKGLFEAGAQFCPKDGARLQPAGQEAGLVGQVIDDRYRIVRKIGQGGMGDVYEAAHVYISKRFALKLLRPEVTGSLESVARFHQEARSASSIGHENIVGIDDFGRLPDGSVYLAMELLEGQSLGQRLKQPPPPAVDETIACALQICEGLAAAHDKGVIHRDMKPDNVFLAEKGGVVIAKILDFGIAKMAGDGSAGGTLTRTGAVFGTPH